MAATEFTANQIARILSDGTITEYPVPDANSEPGGISTGVDGRLWFVEHGANALARISTGAPWHVDPGPPVIDQQATIVRTPFARPLVATVLDPDGTPLAGATITFTAPDTGASGTFPDGSTIATAITDANGVATSPTLTANDTVGSYTATATRGVRQRQRHVCAHQRSRGCDRHTGGRHTRGHPARGHPARNRRPGADHARPAGRRPRARRRGAVRCSRRHVPFLRH